MMRVKKLILCLIIFILAVVTCIALASCSKSKELILASTTSTQDSGLFDVLIPAFEKASGYKVKLIAVGTGEAITLGEKGEADVLLVHSRKAEDKFVADGFGVNRKDVMHNSFIIVGPKDDPAKIKGLTATDAFKAIASNQSLFVSRGDDSGTNKKELDIWGKADIEPSGNWYIESGNGMGETLAIANERQGYTLTDNATWLAQKSNFELVALVGEEEILYNPYGVIAVNPSKHPELKINYEGAMAFVNYITGKEGQEIIRNFGADNYGEPLFFPDAIK